MWESVSGFFKAAKDLFVGKRKNDQRDSLFDGLNQPVSKRSRMGSRMDENNDVQILSHRQYLPSPVKKSENHDETVVILTSTPASKFPIKSRPKSPKPSPIVYDISDDEDDEPVPRRFPCPPKPKVPEVIDLESPDYREKAPHRTHEIGRRSPISFVGRYSPSRSKKNELQKLLYQSPSSSTSWLFKTQQDTRTFNVERGLEHAKTDLNELLPSPSSTVSKPVVSRKASGASTSAAVSVADNSDSSGSPVSDMKPSSSVERLDGRSPLADLNEKFELWDPMRWRSKLSRSADAKARQLMIEQLSTEGQLRHNARLSKQKSVSDEVRIRLRWEGLLVEEIEIVEDEFATLSDDQVAQVRRAVGPGRGEEVLVKAFDVEITRKDLKTLVGLNWLNDEIVNFFFLLLMDRGGKEQLPKVYTTNTFFYPKIIQGGQASVKRWTRKIDVFSYDMMLVPVHLGNHWCLAVVDFRKETIQYYDSFGGSNDECLQALAQYLEDEHMDKKKEPFDTSGWELVTMTDIPRQTNGSDCGVFACRFAEYVSRDAPITFTQEHMPYFRTRTIFEILTKKLF